MAYGGASRFSTNDPFYYHLWCADGTERVERIPPGRIRPRSASATCDDPPTKVDIPSSTSTNADPAASIDETHMPKKLTIATENLICRFSGTHLTHLEDIVDGMEHDSELQRGLRTSIDSVAPVQLQAHQQKQQSRELHESRVLVLYTGGTIGMCNRSGVYLPDQHYLPAAIRELPPLNDIDYMQEHYSHTHLKPYCLPAVRGVRKRVVYWLVEYDPLLDSSDMTFDDWIRIAHDIEKSYQAYDGFVILHGTDTLAYTACALSFMMENLGKPVVLTGAQIPVAEVRSDGLENMIGALIVAGSLDIPEVTILFNNRLMRGNRSVKIDNFGLDAFNSPNMAPLATMDITINVNYESIFRSPDVAPFQVHGNLCRNVVVLRIFPSMPIESVQATLRPPTRGVVLQSFGSGNISMRRLDIIDEIACAVKRGCLVLNVSQCVKGRVDVNYESAQMLSDAGVIAGSDMTTEAALTKLAYVLYKDEWDYETKTMMLKRNLRGELTVIHSEHLDEMDLISRLSKFLGITSSAETRLLRNALFPPLVCNAAHGNDVQLLEQLRVSGANVTSADYSQRTALHVAAAAGNREAVEYLLRHAVNVHARDSSGENALTCAVRSRNVDVISAIRRAGAQLIADSQRIGSELCLAAARHDLKSLKAWHAAGADLGATDYGGRTALHVACRNSDAAVVEFLCANGGGNASTRDHGGRSVADEYRWAAERSSAAAADVKLEEDEPPITMAPTSDDDANKASDDEDAAGAAEQARKRLRRIAHLLRMESPERKKIE